jgi:hypothetical protein
MSFTLAGAYALMSATTSSQRTGGYRTVCRDDCAGLVGSGFILPSRRPVLYLKLGSMVLVALVLYDFIDLLSSFALRRNGQTQVIIADAIWIAFAILLYWALKNGPAIPSAVTD